MKIHKILLIFLAALLFSCEDKKEDENPIVKPPEIPEITDPNEYTEINKWIYKDMAHYYYWYKDMPTPTAASYNKKPNEFYSPLLSSKDRFSSLEHEGQTVFVPATRDASAKVTYDRGFGISGAYFVNGNDAPLYIRVTYVRKGSFAEGKLKRGDVITAVDGVPLTYGNFGAIFDKGNQATFTLSTKQKVTVNYTPNFTENPILLSKVINEGTKKVGYIVYNFFASAPDNAKDYVWSLEMNNILKDFQAKAIDELVLDLRYNPGGYVHSGTYIASAIAPNRSGKIYTKRNYNDKLEKEDSYKNNKLNYFNDVIEVGRASHPIPQLSLTRLYVLTSRNTASASEQIINGLRPYMTVEVIGEKTTGKNMESFPVKDNQNTAHTWILHPLTAVSYNSLVSDAKDNDYSGGFEPTLPKLGDVTSEVAWLEDQTGKIFLGEKSLKELGDPTEVLLNIALNHIAGRAMTRAYQLPEYTLESKTLLDPNTGIHGAILTKQEIEPNR